MREEKEEKGACGVEMVSGGRGVRGRKGGEGHLCSRDGDVCVRIFGRGRGGGGGVRQTVEINGPQKAKKRW